MPLDRTTAGLYELPDCPVALPATNLNLGEGKRPS